MSYTINLNTTVDGSTINIYASDTNGKTAQYSGTYASSDTESIYGYWHSNGYNYIDAVFSYNLITNNETFPYNVTLQSAQMLDPSTQQPATSQYAQNSVFMDNIYTVTLYSYQTACTTGNINTFMADYTDNNATYSDVSNNIFFDISSNIVFNNPPTCSTGFNNVSANLVPGNNYSTIYTFYSDSDRQNITATVTIVSQYTSSGWVPISCQIVNVNTSTGNLAEIVGFISNLYYSMSYYISSYYLTSTSSSSYSYYLSIWYSQLSVCIGMAAAIQTYLV